MKPAIFKACGNLEIDIDVLQFTKNHTKIQYYHFSLELLAKTSTSFLYDRLNITHHTTKVTLTLTLTLTPTLTQWVPFLSILLRLELLPFYSVDLDPYRYSI